MIIDHPRLQDLQWVVQTIVPPSDHPCRIGPGPVVPGSQQPVEQTRTDDFDRLERAQGLVEMMFVTGVPGIQSLNPGVQCAGTLGRIPGRQGPLGLVPGPVFG